MLTIPVNIAVFAVFRICFARCSAGIAEFKRLCRERQRDVSRYGRQKRQEVARSGKADGKNGMVWRDVGCPRRHAYGCGWARWAGLREYAIVKVLARLGGRVDIELIYHKESGMSRGAAADCRAGKGIAALRQNPSGPRSRLLRQLHLAEEAPEQHILHHFQRARDQERQPQRQQRRLQQQPGDHRAARRSRAAR